MAVLGWFWLVSPFVLIAVISHDPNMRELVGVHHRRCQAIGSAGVAAMVLGAAAVPGPLGSVLFGLGTPLSGLIVWMRRDGGDDSEDGRDHPPPNWDDFERSFWAYVRRRNRPRAPASR